LKYILLLLLASTFLYSNELNLDSFKAKFIQTVTNDKGHTLEYKGSIVASKPQYMLWSYTFPAKKDIVINNYRVTVIEYDIEQVQIRNIHGDFDFFKILKKAKKIKPNVYEANFNEIKYLLKLDDGKISSISYLDELENSILITFSEQEENVKIDKSIFTPNIPLDFDIIRD
jgi:outer membrane lipoprotein carrier protein